MRAVQTLSHPQRVRILYKTILRLHKSLPREMQELGDQYVRAEFRRHLNAKSEFVPQFMVEWSKYASSLSKQLNSSVKQSGQMDFGSALSDHELSCFSEQQLNQLLTLAEEIHGKNSSAAD